ncbi:MAG: ABC transporter permease [Candidatus Ozemobacteraceae bacterium]
MLLRTWMIVWKELLQIRRDPRMLIVVIVIPVLMLILYGYAINLDVNHLAFAVLDDDRSDQSREFVGAFENSGYFDIVAHPHDRREAEEMLDRGNARAVLFIPPTFARDLAAGNSAQVQLLVDGSDSTTANTAIGYVSAIVRERSTMVTLDWLRKAGKNPERTFIPVDHRVRYWYNPELKSPNFLVPGLIAVILMMLAALLTSMTVIRERERGTIEALISTPIRPIELMVGKLIPYVLIAFCDVIMVTFVSMVIFGVPLRGNPFLLLALSGVFLTAALGIGLLISTNAPSQQMAMMVALLVAQLPTVLLSGFIFPITSMPKDIQWLTSLIPATHFIRILRGIFLKGSGIDVLWKPALFLLAIGVVTLALSAARFKKKL